MRCFCFNRCVYVYLGCVCDYVCLFIDSRSEKIGERDYFVMVSFSIDWWVLMVEYAALER